MTVAPLIRPMKPADIPAAAHLLRQLAEASIVHEFSPAARESLLSKNDGNAIAKFLADGFRYHVAEVDGEIVGFIGIRDNAHLYHLFVARPLQRRGIGRRLWNAAALECRERGNPGRFTVNSSNNAVAMYERLGLRRSAPPQNSGGCPVQPDGVLR